MMFFLLLNLKLSSMKSKSFIRIPAQYFFIIVFLLSLSAGVQAAERGKVVTGVITDMEGNPVIGANIAVKNYTQGAISDIDGKYAVEVEDDNAVLVFSYIGYNTQEIKVGKKTVIDVRLTEKANLLEDVVVVGYGSMKKGEITSAITNVKSDEFVQGVVKDATQLLQGKVAGLQMSNPSGDPTAGMQINIRGVATVSSSTDPLIIIDGIPGGNLNTIAPEDVETIDVLKDGSAAAIYGTRGTNGVIIITTKKARGGAASLEYHGYVALESLQKKVDMLDAGDYRSLIKDPLFKDKISDEGTSTDWIDAITRNAVSHVHNLSLRGGTNKTNYIASITYRSQDGILLNTGKEALTLKLGINHSMMNDKLKIQLNVNNSTIKQNVTWANAYLQACLMNPTRPIYNEDGSYKEYGTSYKPYNPVALLKEETDQEKWNQLLASGKIILSPIEGLNVSAMFAMQRYDSMRDKWNTFNYFTTTIENKNGEVNKWANQSFDKTLELTADYTKSIDKHNFTALVGYSYQDFTHQGSWMYAMDFPTDIFGPWNIGTAQSIKDGKADMSSYKDYSRLISFFGRLTYNYDDKYMVMASLRREGSSKFGANHKWGLFPAVSMGWRMKRESFMEDADLIDDLKFRVGFGVTGTELTDSYQSLVLLNYSGIGWMNGAWTNGVVPATNPNPDLKWETKAEWNLGMDFSFFNQRLNGSVDLYQRTTSDLLSEYQVPVPPNFTSTMWANVGKIRNRGVEVAIEGQLVKAKNFTWTLGGNFSYNSNKLLSLSNEKYKRDYWYTGWTSSGIQQPTHIVKEGEPLGNFYGWKTVGLNDEGLWLIEDADGNPKLASQAGQEDKQVIGNGLPSMYAGVNTTFKIKNVDLSIGVRGAFDFDVLNEYRMHWETMKRISEANLPASVLNKPYGGSSYVWDSQMYHSHYIERGDYVKIDNITLGYNFNFNSAYIKNVRLYVSGHNLFTFTDYSGLDPEVSIKGLDPGVERKEIYPTVRSYTIGAVVKF